MLALARRINIFGRKPVDFIPSKAPHAGTPAAPESRAVTEALHIEYYDRLNVEAVSRRLVGLRVEELERLRKYEAENKNRRRLMARSERRISAATALAAVKSGMRKNPSGSIGD